MKKILFLATLISLVLGLGSCSDSDKNPDGPFAGEFKVGVTELTFLKTAATQTLYVAAPAKPAVTSDSEWLTVGDIALNGESSSVYAVAVNVTDNNVYDNRTGNLKITCGANEATVKVTQRNSDGILLADGFTAPEVKADGETLEIPVLATGEYTATVSDTWMEIVPAPVRGLVESKVYVKVSSNISSDKRTGDIVLTLNADKNATLTVTLTQAGGGAANINWPDYPKGNEIGETATEAAKHIYAGWNIGNTMEVPAGKTGWGNPMVNQALIDGVAKAGFNAVRIPLSWGAAQKLVADAEPWTIKEDWLNRVKEVVDYCYSRGLYVIINCHWDGGWLELHANMTDGPAVAKKEAAIWTQIADKFKDYGQRLIFAGNNEIRNTRNGNEWWGEPNADECKAVDLFNQTFVDAVRATGGNNAQRNLVVQSYCCNPWYALNKTAIPNDPAKNHLMMEVHFYDPFNYTHSADNDQYWGYRKGYVTTNTDQEDHVDDVFGRLKAKFVDNGIPVVLGEYGTTLHSNDARIKESEQYYMEYITKAAKDNGIIPFTWDNGEPRVGMFGLFNRSNGQVGSGHIVDGIMTGATNGKYPY